MSEQPMNIPNADIETVTAQVIEMQAKYREWQQLSAKLEQACQDWYKVNELVVELSEYYHSEDWLVHHDLDAADPEQALARLAGEDYSVLAEDTLWEVMASHRHLAVKQMGLALEALENEEYTLDDAYECDWDDDDYDDEAEDDNA